MHRARAVDVSMSRIRSSTSVPVNPLEPMLSSVAGDQVLKVIGGRDTLSLDSAKEVLLDGVCVVSERHLDGSLESVDVAVVAGSLVGLVLLHKRDELLGGPALGLEVIVVRGRSTSVHLAPD